MNSNYFHPLPSRSFRCCFQFLSLNSNISVQHVIWNLLWPLLGKGTFSSEHETINPPISWGQIHFVLLLIKLRKRKKWNYCPTDRPKVTLLGHVKTQCVHETKIRCAWRHHFSPRTSSLNAAKRFIYNAQTWERPWFLEQSFSQPITLK